MEKNIESLLKKLKLKKCHFYLVSTFDEYLSEYPPDRNMRLKWLTKFSGSNGIALISSRQKYFFTDGRYILQAKKEIDKDFKVIDMASVNLFSFIKKTIKNRKLLIDFKIFKIDFIEKLKKIAINNNFQIIHDETNSIDELWVNRPKEIKKSSFFISKSLSGETTERKLKRLFDNFSHNYFIVNSSESVCWLLNIRGYDLPYTPIVFSRMIISKLKVKVFMDKDKFPKGKINESKVEIYDSKNFYKEILKIPKKSSILFDEMSSYFLLDLMKNNGFKPEVKKDPCVLLKCQKNKIEIANAKKIHVLDALSLVKYFFWLENQENYSRVNELEVSKKLEAFRRENDNFFSNSFETISATGRSGSIIHYNPKISPKRLLKGQLYLCDSGGQYFGGTTDVTRTIILGNETNNKEYIANYTSVLMGHINLSLIKFPIGTKGNQIDGIARLYLWQNGLDYNHGTGHGVGSFLGVHEGPQSVSKKSGLYELKEGMILSNEPGFYKNDAYGIRIENLLLVKKSKFKGFLEFETLTLCPYERNLINSELLSKQHILWLNNYHSYIYKNLSKFLEKDLKIWLHNKTKKIK